MKRNYPLSCKQCSKEFFGLRPVDKFCSPSCKGKFNKNTPKAKAYQSKKNKENWAKNKDKLKLDYRKWKALNRDHLLSYWRKYNASRDKVKNFQYYLKRIWGLTFNEYHKILEKQNWCCAICGRPASDFGKRLALDHDHHTGEIRSALCYNCNRNLIGHWRDPELFEKAAKYLRGPFTGKFKPKRRRKK